MESIWSTHFLFDSGASDASKNKLETLIFSKNVKETRKKRFHLWQDLNPGPVGQKTNALPSELSELY